MLAVGRGKGMVAPMPRKIRREYLGAVDHPPSLGYVGTSVLSRGGRRAEFCREDVDRPDFPPTPAVTGGLMIGPPSPAISRTDGNDFTNLKNEPSYGLPPLKILVHAPAGGDHPKQVAFCLLRAQPLPIARNRRGGSHAAILIDLLDHLVAGQALGLPIRQASGKAVQFVGAVFHRSGRVVILGWAVSRQFVRAVPSRRRRRAGTHLRVEVRITSKVGGARSIGVLVWVLN